MKRVLLAAAALMPALSLGACAGGYYGGGGGYYAGGPVAYDGFYDDYYGPIYDGYWGTDGFFYYRGGVGEHRFRRGDPAHFHRGGSGGVPSQGHFRAMQGSFAPARGMSTPHFGGGAPHGGGRGGHH